MNAEKLTSVVPEAVRQLLEQRSTYREWLSRLDEVGGKYRTEVAERVRVDYEARLDGVGEELAEHRHDLAASLERRRARLDELTEAFERHSAELEEAELRFQVGEFDDATWEETREKLAESIEGIEGELDEARSAVGELERVLGELGGGNGSEGSAAPHGAGAKAPAAAARPPAASRARESAEAADSSGAGAGVAADAAPDAGVSAQVEARNQATEADEAPEADETTGADEAGAAEAEEADVTADAEVAAQVGSATERSSEAPDGGSEDYLDELEFLESLSLDDPDSFDAVSRMLEDEEDR